MAERQGFEPWEPSKGLNGFRNRPVQPLRHLSAYGLNRKTRTNLARPSPGRQRTRSSPFSRAGRGVAEPWLRVSWRRPSDAAARPRPPNDIASVAPAAPHIHDEGNRMLTSAALGALDIKAPWMYVLMHENHDPPSG